MRGNMYVNESMTRAAVKGVAVRPLTHEADNFAERRANCAGAGVSYDPESLLTEAERAAGFDYDCPRNRGKFPEERGSVWQAACRGEIPAKDIPLLFPREHKVTADSIG